MVVVVGGRSQGWVGLRLVLGGVCFEAIAKILQRRHISDHLKNLRIISGNIVSGGCCVVGVGVGVGECWVGVGEWWVLCGGGWWWWWSGGEAKGGWVCVGCWEVCVSRLGPRFCQDGTFPAI